MTPRPEAIPNQSFDDEGVTPTAPAVRLHEITDDPPPEVVLGSVTRLAVFSASTGSWNRPAHGKRADTATFASVDLVAD